jgi:type II secretory pathway component HofQ
MKTPRFAPAVFLIAILCASAPSYAESIAKALRRPLPDVKLDSVSIADALDYIRDVTAVNIVVNWRALEAAGVSKDTTVTVRLRGVPLRRVLQVILSEAGGTTELAFTHDEDVMEITTKELADKRLITRIYPVEDLIMDVPDFTNAPPFNLSEVTQTSSGGGGGQSLISGTSAGGNDMSTMTRAERGQQLVDLIQSLIQPDIWTTNGGTASIRFFNGTLIVTAPESVHEALSGED